MNGNAFIWNEEEKIAVIFEVDGVRRLVITRFRQVIMRISGFSASPLIIVYRVPIRHPNLTNRSWSGSWSIFIRSFAASRMKGIARHDRYQEFLLWSYRLTDSWTNSLCIDIVTVPLEPCLWNEPLRSCRYCSASMGCEAEF